MSNRIGILGGTFNPVHQGHVTIGRRLLEDCGLERILYVLSADPPHKRLAPLAAAPTRWEMLCRALEPYPQLQPCDVEIRRQGPSFTIDTLRELRAALPGDTLCFIAGSEGFLRIRTWKAYREILELVFFIVVLRRETHRPALQRLLAEEGLPVCSADRMPATPPGVWLYEGGSPLLELSSTTVRKTARRHGDLTGMVDERVRHMMEESNLYERESL